MELQRHLRVHAAKDDFATTVSKARQFLDASELTRTVKKPAIRTASPSVNFQSIVDGVLEALERDRGRMAEVNTAQAPNSNNRSKKIAPRQGSPALSNASSGSSASRASSTSRTVRFQDQEDARSGSQTYGSSNRSRWQRSQSAQGNGNGPRPWSDRRQPGQASPRSQPSGSDWMQRQSGPRFPPPQPGGSWTQGQGGPRLRPPASGNTSNWRPGWRSSSGDRGGQQPTQQQYSSGQRRWSQGSADQQPPAIVNTPPPRRRGCYVCGQRGCHSDFHGPGAVSPQAPPAMGCFVCGQRGCHSSRHEASAQLPIPSAPSKPVRSAPAPAMGTASPAVKLTAGLEPGRAGPADQCSSTPSVKLKVACVSAEAQTDRTYVRKGRPVVNFLD